MRVDCQAKSPKRLSRCGLFKSHTARMRSPKKGKISLYIHT